MNARYVLLFKMFPLIGDGLAVNICPHACLKQATDLNRCVVLSFGCVLMQIDSESRVPHVDSLLSSGVNPLMTGAVSRRATNAISASVFDFGHSA
jgi:hypothetical protein